MTTITKYFGVVSPSTTIPTKSVDSELVKITSLNYIGIEVEVEKLNTGLNVPEYWNSTTDGSLRNNGQELISVPIPAYFAPTILRNLFVELERQNTHFSPRTSIHVHVDCTKYTLAEVQNIVLLYTLVEKYLYSFVSKNRQQNIYCIPLIETNLLNSFLTNEGFQDWSKYTGLNLRPLREIGTIEFRQLHGTMDLDKVCNWITLITKLVNFAVSQNDKEFKQFISELDASFNIDQFLVKIFGEHSRLLKINNPVFYLESYLLVKQCFFNRLVPKDIKINTNSALAKFNAYKGND